tara:strand:+ start:7232 stop:7495 length:264 start_codon:yes stop_codon:yes gene_type:complete
MTIRLATLAAAISFAIVPSAIAQQQDHTHQGDGPAPMQQMMKQAGNTADSAGRHDMMSSEEMRSIMRQLKAKEQMRLERVNRKPGKR